MVVEASIAEALLPTTMVMAVTSMSMPFKATMTPKAILPWSGAVRRSKTLAIGERDIVVIEIVVIIEEGRRITVAAWVSTRSRFQPRECLQIAATMKAIIMVVVTGIAIAGVPVTMTVVVSPIGKRIRSLKVITEILTSMSSAKPALVSPRVEPSVSMSLIEAISSALSPLGLIVGPMTSVSMAFAPKLMTIPRVVA